MLARKLAAPQTLPWGPSKAAATGLQLVTLLQAASGQTKGWNGTQYASTERPQNLFEKTELSNKDWSGELVLAKLVAGVLLTWTNPVAL